MFDKKESDKAEDRYCKALSIFDGSPRLGTLEHFRKIVIETRAGLTCPDQINALAAAINDMVAVADMSNMILSKERDFDISFFKQEYAKAIKQSGELKSAMISVILEKLFQLSVALSGHEKQPELLAFAGKVIACDKLQWLTESASRPTGIITVMTDTIFERASIEYAETVFQQAESDKGNPAFNAVTRAARDAESGVSPLQRFKFVEHLNCATAYRLSKTEKNRAALIAAARQAEPVSAAGAAKLSVATIVLGTVAVASLALGAAALIAITGGAAAIPIASVLVAHVATGFLGAVAGAGLALGVVSGLGAAGLLVREGRAYATKRVGMMTAPQTPLSEAMRNLANSKSTASQPGGAVSTPLADFQANSRSSRGPASVIAAC